MKRPSALVAASAACAAAALAASAWHVAVNAAPPAWDDAWYLETSFRLWSALRAGPAAFASAYVEAFRFKAPLVALIPFPLYAVAGPGERIAVWANLPLAAAAAYFWSRAAAAWWRGHPRAAEAAALGGALAALLPLSYGLSRLFFVETLTSALIAAWAWRCASGEGRREGVRLGLILGAGLLAKSTFPLAAAGFAWAARDRLRPHARTAAAVAAALAATWYAFNLPYVAGFAWSAAFGRIASDYSGGGGGPAPLAWIVSTVRDGISWPLAAAGLAVVAASAFHGRKPPAGIAAPAWGAAPLLVYALGVNRDPRLPSPLLPVLALLAARAAVSFERPRARAAAAAVLLAAGLGVCAGQTVPALAAAPLSYNGVPSSDPGWDRAALVEAARDAAGPGGTAAVALEHRMLNANNLASLAASRGWALRFVSLGYAQTDAESALIRLKDKDATALIIVDGAEGAPGFLNRANAGIAAAVRSGRLRARETARVPLAPGVSARVYALGNLIN